LVKKRLNKQANLQIVNAKTVLLVALMLIPILTLYVSNVEVVPTFLLHQVAVVLLLFVPQVPLILIKILLLPV